MFYLSMQYISGSKIYVRFQTKKFFFRNVGMIVWENVMSLVDVKLVRMELDYQTVIEVSKHNAGKTSQCGSLL